MLRGRNCKVLFHQRDDQLSTTGTFARQPIFFFCLKKEGMGGTGSRGPTTLTTSKVPVRYGTVR